MGLGKEIFRHSQEERSPFSRKISLGSENIIHPPSLVNFELRLMKVRELLARLKKELRKDYSDHKSENKGSGKKVDGFEPFINPDSQENHLLVNAYGGHFAQQMDLNRNAVEKALKIAHLDGKVFLTSKLSFPPSEESQELVEEFIYSKRRVNSKKKEFPILEVSAIEEGWRIEIDDRRLRKELEERNFSDKELQKRFVEKFNVLLRKGIRQCVRREKLTNTKDKHLWRKVIGSVLPLMFATLGPQNDLIFLGIYLGMNAVFNIAMQKITYDKGDHRKFDHKLEYLMPPVEIDKVGRTFAYLTLKGRTLVKEKENKEK